MSAKMTLDLATLENHIIQQDCITGMQALPVGSVDLVFADPPFNIGYDYDVYRDQLEHHRYLDWSRDWMSAVWHCLKPDGTFWLAIGDEYAAELKVLAQEIGFSTRSWVIWYYTFGVNCKNKFSRSHAHLFYFVKDPQKFTFRGDELENRIPSARQLVYNDRRANPNGRLPDDTWMIPADFSIDQKTLQRQHTWTLRPQDIEACFQAKEDTWYFPRVAGTFKERAGFHGCQMPEQLLARIIRSCAEPAGLVLDPFSGSATTLVVAKKLGRKYLGFDISEQYIEHGRERLLSVRVGDRLEGAAEPLLSAPKTDNKQSHTEKSGKKAGSHQQPSLFTAWNDAPARESKTAEDQLQWTYSGVEQAFRTSCVGQSLDAVLIDPKLNNNFIAACQQLGLAGDPFTWNRLLFVLREQGRFSDYELQTAACYQLEFRSLLGWAAEMSLQFLMARQNFTAWEELFCHPESVAEFDRLVSRLVPGEYEPIIARSLAREISLAGPTAYPRGHVLLSVHKKTIESQLQSLTSLLDLSASALPDLPGLFLIRAVKSETFLYAGETEQLAETILHLQSADFSCLNLVTADLEISCWAYDWRSAEPFSWQSAAVQNYQPTLNLSY